MDKKMKITEEQIERARAKLEQIIELEDDLPHYVCTRKYEAVLIKWIELQLAEGRKNIECMVIIALKHETGGRQPLFQFKRK